jgi:hypothetical protein
MVEVICFSKDRPRQLDAYLRSLRQQARFEFRLNVLYTTSAPAYASAYRELREQHRWVRWIPEEQFRPQVEELVAQAHSKILFGVDDAVYIGPVWEEVLPPDALGFSYRLAPYVDYCQVQGKPMRFHGQAVDGDPERVWWAWPEAEEDFSYPLELVGTLYDKPALEELFAVMRQEGEAWKNPNTLEVSLDAFRSVFADTKPKLLSYREQKCVVVTLNWVQTESQNPLEREFSPAELLGHFNAGERFDLGVYEGRRFRQVHIGDFRLVKNFPG